MACTLALFVDSCMDKIGCYEVGGLDKRKGPNLDWLGPLYMAGKWTPGFVFSTLRLLYFYKTLS